jgi:response regulator RpfG family c-di-GMP phosphodiesterase
VASAPRSARGRGGAFVSGERKSYCIFQFDLIVAHGRVHLGSDVNQGLVTGPRLRFSAIRALAPGIATVQTGTTPGVAVTPATLDATFVVDSVRGRRGARSAAARDEMSLQPRANAPISGSSSMRPFASHQVLVIESDPWLQHAVARWIEGAGFECLPVGAADEALALAQEEEADVAIVSGVVDAWTPAHLAHALQSRDADLPVIVVRPSGETARGFRGRRGAVEEIEAPLTRGSVMRAVHRALEWRDASADDRARYRELERSVFSQAALMRDACHSEPCNEASLTSAFTAFLDRRLPGAAGHAARTRVVALELAMAIGMDDAARHVVGQAATLHELGLALLPQPLRQPAETLTGLDRVLALRHPDVVFELLSSMPGQAEAAAVVRASHERFDGAGHPRGLSGLEIPMGARLIAVACAVDRIATGDAGRPGLTAPAAQAALTALAGTALDPDLVRVWAGQGERQLAAH